MAQLCASVQSLASRALGILVWVQRSRQHAKKVLLRRSCRSDYSSDKPVCWASQLKTAASCMWTALQCVQLGATEPMTCHWGLANQSGFLVDACQRPQVVAGLQAPVGNNRPASRQDCRLHCLLLAGLREDSQKCSTSCAGSRPASALDVPCVCCQLSSPIS